MLIDCHRALMSVLKYFSDLRGMKCNVFLINWFLIIDLLYMFTFVLMGQLNESVNETWFV